MRFIVAVIKPQKLEAVRKALGAVGVSGLTVTEVKGFGRQKGHKEVYRGTEYQVDFLPKLKIELAVPAQLAQPAAEAICKAAKTGSIGDGKLFIFDLVEVIRVRTGEVGVDAI